MYCNRYTNWNIHTRTLVFLSFFLTNVLHRYRNSYKRYTYSYIQTRFNIFVQIHWYILVQARWYKLEHIHTYSNVDISISLSIGEHPGTAFIQHLYNCHKCRVFVLPTQFILRWMMREEHRWKGWRDGREMFERWNTIGEAKWLLSLWRHFVPCLEFIYVGRGRRRRSESSCNAFEWVPLSLSSLSLFSPHPHLKHKTHHVSVDKLMKPSPRLFAMPSANPHTVGQTEKTELTLSRVMYTE